MKRILHTIAPVHFGGGESLLSSLLQCPVSDISETVACLSFSQAFSAKLDEGPIHRIQVSNTDLGHGLPKWKMALFALRLLSRVPMLVRQLQKQSIDLIHAHGFPAILISVLAGFLSKTPVIYTHHGARRHAPSTLEKRVLGWTYRRCRKRTAVSRTVADQMTGFFQDSGGFVAIPNCVSPAFSNAPADPKALKQKPPHRRVGVYPARLTAVKHHDQALRALADIPDGERPVLWFIGDGPERSFLEQMVRQLALQDDIVFWGHVPHEQLPGMVAAADFGFFLGQEDAFGIAAAECLVAGKPLLAIDTAVMRELSSPATCFTTFDMLATHLHEFSVRPLPSAASVDHILPEGVKSNYVSLYREVFNG